MGLFENRTHQPIWFMRQAGRYHSHYQNIKKNSDFMTMCKNPELACEVTMGPINDFNFDAAILFSDLLFPLEHLGMGLNYLQGPPKLEYYLSDRKNLDRINPVGDAAGFYDFQKKAIELLKETLPADRTMLGFVGAPFTLFTYAVEGSHAGNLVSAKTGLYDGCFDNFLEKLLPSLKEEMNVQAQGGADAICLFDTAAGELSLHDYKKFIIPVLRNLTADFKHSHPNTKIVYYSKHTHLEYLHALEDKNIDVLGIDWRVNLAQTLDEFSKDYYIQGNFDPCWLHLPWNQLEQNLISFYDSIKSRDLSKWICGLGHGVTVKTPEENVRNAVKFFHNLN